MKDVNRIVKSAKLKMCSLTDEEAFKLWKAHSKSLGQDWVDLETLSLDEIWYHISAFLD